MSYNIILQLHEFLESIRQVEAVWRFRRGPTSVRFRSRSRGRRVGVSETIEAQPRSSTPGNLTRDPIRQLMQRITSQEPTAMRIVSRSSGIHMESSALPTLYPRGGSCLQTCKSNSPRIGPISSNKRYQHGPKLCTWTRAVEGPDLKVEGLYIEKYPPAPSSRYMLTCCQGFNDLLMY